MAAACCGSDSWNLDIKIKSIEKTIAPLVQQMPPTRRFAGLTHWRCRRRRSLRHLSIGGHVFSFQLSGQNIV
ncbi:hypothetical protein HPB50_016500 [Hyalomma asiaticum]|uniref:Uncharacterized protein n=1 Tax=Hyalomma asiaticum TaxID=266040 RepID=A0ACB7SYR5_HYAAI|nr:hypothetical protein HPB50_016500 [Hyalomma asiaticum]